MLIVPFVVGAGLRARASELEIWLIPLGLAELAGYLSFYTAGLWLRAAPARRGGYLAPLRCYGLIAVACLAGVVALGGTIIFSWLPVTVPLGASAIWLSTRGRDRSIASGLVSVTLAVGMGVVVRFPNPAELIAGWPVTAPDLFVLGALFGYFAGTVWHVKSLIRQWGNPTARRHSLVWHVVMIFAALAGALSGLGSPAWIAFFAAATARSWWLTRYSAPRPRPAKIGIIEIVLSAAALLIALW